MDHRLQPLRVLVIALILQASLYMRPALAELPSSLQSGVAPHPDRWVQLTSSPVADASLTLNPEKMNDPKSLLAFFKSRPDALQVEKMNPQIAVEVGQVLMYGGEATKAVTLLSDARVKWPDDLAILQTWSRAMIRLGTPSYVRVALEDWRSQNTQAQVPSYMRYLYALSLYLEGPEDPQKLSRSINALEELLQLDPNYQGPDGVGAAELNGFLQEMRGKIAQ